MRSSDSVSGAIFNAPDRAKAERMLTQAVESWRSDAPKLATWAEGILADGFTVFSSSQRHRIRLRTTNGLERINREIKHRTRVVSIFPNTASCLRLVSALLADSDGDWLEDKIYLNVRSCFAPHTSTRCNRRSTFYRKEVALPRL